MVEKMTAVWLIILTIIVCASVPAVLIWLTTSHPKVLGGFESLLAFLNYSVIKTYNINNQQIE
jgi:hypothetical protein